MTATTDQELFELCKEVYERTGWRYEESSESWYLFGGEDELIRTIKLTDAELLMKQIAFVAPLYTSDYLLEKLPRDLVDEEHEVHAITLYCGKWTKQWLAGYEGHFGGQNDPSDTPLKALLKLVIALDDAGVKL